MAKFGWNSFAIGSSVLLGSLAFTRSLNDGLWIKLAINIVLSISVYFFTIKTIPKCIQSFLNANLSGQDMGKSHKPIIPESLGIVVGAFYLVTMCIFIPIKYFDIHFWKVTLYLPDAYVVSLPFLKHVSFEQDELVSMLAAILAICCMLMLGFVDDVLNLRWRQKLIFPFIAALPLLIVYYVTYNLTYIMLPKPWNFAIDLGPLYYVYMLMLVIFCTNSINILAGVNGLEVGQAVVISFSILIFNIIEMTGEQSTAHLFSFCFMMPFFMVSIALIAFNWYPAEVFVGDTYCYFSGMTFAVVGILGHFSKTMLLFFLPQIFNFVFSLPQLFHFIPCPRHRLPCFDATSNQMSCSKFKYINSELGTLGRLVIYFYKKFGLVSEEKVKLSSNSYYVTNCTLINLLLHRLGPMKESSVTSILLAVQIFGSCFAFFIRYYLVKFFY